MMKLYAVRDRQIDYYLTPFAAPDQNQVFASVAATINNPETKDAIAQAPHHFEIWQLAIVEDDGTITPEKICLANCSRFIRGGIRSTEDRLAGRTTSKGTTDPSGGSDQQPHGNA